MRRIEITPRMVKEVDDFYSSLFSLRQFTKPKQMLLNLTKIRGFKTGKKREYIDYLYKHYDTIVRLKPSEFGEWKERFNEILPQEKITTKFWEEIVKALRYQDLRKQEYLEFAKKLKIKSCCYCNAQLSVVADVNAYKKPRKKKGQLIPRKATFELDHFEPKSKYPFLATTFFNLYPSCSICNKAKSTNPIKFVLFEESKNLEVFRFVLDRKTEQKYWETKNPDVLDFNFKLIDEGMDDEFRDAYDSMFHITGIYQTQKDIIEDLLYIREAYSNAYKKGLVSLANKAIFPDEAMISKLLIGNYYKSEDVHKRPLAKFTQDIAKQLKLIK